MVNVTTADTINEEVVRRVVEGVQEENLQFRQAYRDIDFSGAPNDTLQIPSEGDNMAEPERIGEGGEFPRSEEDISKTPVTPEKYGFEVAISRESQSDSVFDVVARQVEKQARKMNEKLNELAFSELDGNLHSSSPADGGGTAGTLEFTDVVEGKKILQQDAFNPDLLIVNVQGEADLLNSSEFNRASDLGDETVREGAIGRVAGFDVVLSNDGHMSSSNGEAYLVDTEEYGFEVTKENVATDSYDDPSRHATVYQIWTRKSYAAIKSNAAIKIAP